MISNQILQSTIDGLKGITKRDITVMDVEGSVLATTEDIDIGSQVPTVPDLIHSKAESMLSSSKFLMKLSLSNRSLYATKRF